MPQMGGQAGSEQAAILTLLQESKHDVLGRITVEGNPASRRVAELRKNLWVQPATQFTQLNQDGVPTGIVRHCKLPSRLPGPQMLVSRAGSRYPAAFWISNPYHHTNRGV